MSFKEVALGLASLAIGFNTMKKGFGHLAAAQPPRRNQRFAPQFSGFADGPAMPAPRRPTTLPGVAFAKTGYRTVQMPNGARIPMQMRSFNIRTLDDRINYLRRLVDAGKREPHVYAFARRAVSRQCGDRWCTPEKDNLAEAKAIFGAFRNPNSPDLVAARKMFQNIRKQVRYTSDIAGVDTYQKASHTLALRTGDCLPAGTKLLREDGIIVNIEDVRVGDTIFDGTGWAKITNWWDKGVLNTLAFDLNNGCTLRCTGEHKLFRVPDGRTNADRPASSAQEVLAKDIRVGDDLLQPSELAFSEKFSLPYEEAFLLGAYVAEGSVHHSRVDGKVGTIEIAGIPNSKGVRERAIECALKAGFRVTELDRQIYISDSGDRLHNLVGFSGKYAPQKRLPHVRWSNETALAILQGLNADGGVATNGTNFVFSTTSPTLAVQYRLLQRLFGKSCSIRRVDEHGGFGENPIYRVTVREAGRRPWAKVKGIREGGVAHVFDIETTSHRFYLPEQDVTVHNCDDYSTLTCSALQSIGIPCRFKVIRTKGANDWNHIFPQAGFPRLNPQKWVSMDSSVNMPFGWEAPPRMVADSRVFRVG